MTYVSFGIVGHGAVARQHVTALSTNPAARVVGVFGPRLAGARAFANEFAIPLATDELGELLDRVDAVVICSPNAEHGGQTLAAVRSGRHALVEVPVAQTTNQARTIEMAVRQGVSLLSATQTVRWLPAVRAIGNLLRDGAIGSIFQVVVDRRISKRERSWVDDALVHHAEHAVDALRWWFGRVEPAGAVITPREGPARSVAVVLAIGDGVPATISVTYDAVDDSQRVVIVGSAATITSDGFGRVEVRRASEMSAPLDIALEEAYSSAIRSQDARFVEAILRRSPDDSFADAGATLAIVARIRELASSQ